MLSRCTVSGSALTLNDTPNNRKAYAPVQCAEPNFPMMRIVMLFSVLSGAIVSLVTGDLRTAELRCSTNCSAS
jgi:hypothetical protein